MRKLVVVALAPALLTGCAAIRGGSGSFTADGDVYDVSKVECRRQGDTVTVEATSGPAGAVLVVRGDAVQELRMGAKARPTMGAWPERGIGSATVRVEGTRFVAEGKLAKLDEQGQAAQGPGTEDVGFDVTCRTIRD